MAGQARKMVKMVGTVVLKMLLLLVATAEKEVASNTDKTVKMEHLLEMAAQEVVAEQKTELTV